jgi:hypothetical protein
MLYGTPIEAASTQDQAHQQPVRSAHLVCKNHHSQLRPIHTLISVLFSVVSASVRAPTIRFRVYKSSICTCMEHNIFSCTVGVWGSTFPPGCRASLLRWRRRFSCRLWTLFPERCWPLWLVLAWLLVLSSSGSSGLGLLCHNHCGRCTWLRPEFHLSRHSFFSGMGGMTGWERARVFSFNDTYSSLHMVHACLCELSDVF